MAKAAKNGKIHRIEQMKDMLRAGLDRAEILKKLIKTYKVSIATMDNELKVARQAIKSEQDTKEKILQDKISEQLKSDLNASIASDLELEVILSKIATGNVEIEEWVKDKMVLRNTSPLEVISAIREIYKKRGSYAPVKTAQTNSAGQDIIEIL